MRAPLVCICLSILPVLAACSRESTDSAAQAPPVKLAPLKDWSSLASRPARKPDDQDAAKPSKDEPDPAAVAARPKFSDERLPKQRPTKANPEIDSTRLGFVSRGTRRRALYAGLAKDSLFVLSFPDLARLGPAYKKSACCQLYSHPALQAQLKPMREGLESELQKLREQSPELAAAMDLFPTLGGQVVIGVSGLTPETIAGSPGNLSWVVTVLYDAGEQADRVAEVVAPLFAKLAEKRDWRLEEKPEPSWGCEIGDERFLIDFERTGDVFALRCGGRPAVVRELASARRRADANSFISSRVAVDAADVESLGARSVLEIHVQLSSLWDSLRANGNRADQRVLARTGLTQLFGASLAVGETEQGLAEALTLHSPAGIDILTHALTGEKLDRTLARCVPASLANAGLYSFDGTRIFPDLCLIAPAEAQSAMVRGLAEFRRSTGVDLEKDLLGNFGPTIALGTSGFELPSASLPEMPRFFVAVQLGDPARAQRTLNALMLAADLADGPREKLIDGARVSTVVVPQGELEQGLELKWCISDGVLLVADDLELLREGLRNLHGDKVVHAGLRDGLERADTDCFAIGFTQGDAQTPDSLMFGRRTAAGLEFVAHDGNAVQSTIVAMFGLGIVSSVAIPNLMLLRLEANQKAAGATLLALGAAEQVACHGLYVDDDEDGRGESLFLSELCGAEPVRGRRDAIADPWADADYQWVAPGVGLKSGYRFRVDLPLADGGHVSSVAALAGRHVDADGAEDGFAAFAWPASLSTGKAVFALDPKSGVYASDNSAEGQHYAGDRAPDPHAHWTGAGAPPGDLERYTGRDGGIWVRLRKP